MKKVNLNSLKEVEHKSPKGRFHTIYRNIAAAFRRKAAGPSLPGRPPFEVEHVRVPPGARNFPFHSHSAEWEFYLIVSGKGTVRAGEKRSKIRPGDCLMCPPGEPHQLINNGDEDLVYYVIADNAPTDFWHYPDSGKFGDTLAAEVLPPPGNQLLGRRGVARRFGIAHGWRHSVTSRQHYP